MQADVRITLHGATGIADTQMFGSQDPYCIARVRGHVYNKTGELGAARSDAVDGGGTEPVWDVSHGHGASPSSASAAAAAKASQRAGGARLRIKLETLPAPGCAVIELELWAHNMAFPDERIGMATLELPLPSFDEVVTMSGTPPPNSGCAPVWHALDTGGRLQCTITVVASPKPELAGLGGAGSGVHGPASTTLVTPPKMRRGSFNLQNGGCGRGGGGGGGNSGGGGLSDTEQDGSSIARSESDASHSSLSSTLNAGRPARPTLSSLGDVMGFGDFVPDAPRLNTSAHLNVSEASRRRATAALATPSRRDRHTHANGQHRRLARGTSEHGQGSSSVGSHRCGRTPRGHGSTSRTSMRRRTRASGAGTVSGGVPAVGSIAVVVHRAMSLESDQLFGTIDPFVVASLVMPGQHEGAGVAAGVEVGSELERVRTGTVEGGGVNPVWDSLGAVAKATASTGDAPGEGRVTVTAADGGGGAPPAAAMHAVASGSNAVRLKLQHGAVAIRLEVWNQNMVLDELLGVTQVPLSSRILHGWARTWWALSAETLDAVEAELRADAAAARGGGGGSFLGGSGRSSFFGGGDERHLERRGRLECSIRYEPPVVSAGVVIVEVQQAEGISDVQAFGAQDPYVSAALKTSSGELTQVKRTKCCTSGGTAPVWGAGGNTDLGSRLLLHIGEEELRRKVELLQLELWNENTVLDDEIGAVAVELSGAMLARGTRAWYNVTTGGRLEVSIRHVPADAVAGVDLHSAEALAGCHNGGGAVPPKTPPPSLLDVSEASMRYGPIPPGRDCHLGVVITLKGAKPADLELSQLSLHLEGDKLWEALPVALAWVIQKSFMPLELAPGMVDMSAAFPRGAEAYCAEIGIGTKQNGTIGVRDFKIRSAVEMLVEGGDHPFTCRLVADDSNKTLLQITARPSSYLRALADNTGEGSCFIRNGREVQPADSGAAAAAAASS